MGAEIIADTHKTGDYSMWYLMRLVTFCVSLAIFSPPSLARERNDIQLADKLERILKLASAEDPELVGSIAGGVTVGETSDWPLQQTGNESASRKVTEFSYPSGDAKVCTGEYEIKRGSKFDYTIGWRNFEETSLEVKCNGRYEDEVRNFRFLVLSDKKGTLRLGQFHDLRP